MLGFKSSSSKIESGVRGIHLWGRRCKLALRAPPLETRALVSDGLQAKEKRILKEGGSFYDTFIQLFKSKQLKMEISFHLKLSSESVFDTDILWRYGWEPGGQLNVNVKVAKIYRTLKRKRDFFKNLRGREWAWKKGTVTELRHHLEGWAWNHSKVSGNILWNHKTSPVTWKALTVYNVFALLPFEIYGRRESSPI